MSDDTGIEWPHHSVDVAPNLPVDPDFTFRLDDGAALSAECNRGPFIVDDAGRADNWLVASFGRDTPTDRNVAVTTYNVNASRMRGYAGDDARLVAWLLTHREELIRLARIGADVTARALPGQEDDRG